MSTTSRLSNDDYTVGWICALTEEHVAAQLFLDEEHGTPADKAVHDNNDYTLGRIGSHNVVIAVLPHGEYGTASAAGVARDMLHTFHNIRIGLMVGIAGGAPTLENDTRLGDVVVGVPRNGLGAVFQYDYGKTIQDQPFLSTRFLAPPPTLFLTAINGLRAKYERYGNTIRQDIEVRLEAEQQRVRKKYSRPDTATDVLCQSDIIHPPGKLPCTSSCTSKVIPRPDRDEDEDYSVVHYGLIATANQLMKDAKLRDQYARERGILCFEMEAGGLVNHFPCLVIRGICDYSDTHKNKQWQGYAAMAAAAYAKDLLHRISPNQVEKERAILTVLEAYPTWNLSLQLGQDVFTPWLQRLIDLKLAQKLSVSNPRQLRHEKTYKTFSNKSVHNVHQSMVFDRLDIAVGASFDSYAQEHDRYCLSNTRVELLQLVAEWAKNNHTEPIFWLNGMAGTGKSTISRTVAKLFADTGQLGASFFFKKGEMDRGGLSKFVTTIAADLVVRRPSTASYIEAALNANRSITVKNVTEQFEKLLLEPLSKSDIGGKPIVIIVDALDECEQADDVELLLHLFSQFESKLPCSVRIFLTSRPEEPFRSHFEKIKQARSRVILHEIPQMVVEHDIHAFLTYELSRIRADFNRGVAVERRLSPSWPSKHSIDELVKLAVPLFIIAATICRFISDKRVGSPEKMLERVLSQSAHGLPPLETTYRSILDNLTADVSADQQEQIIAEFRQVVGSIVLLGSPLSKSSLVKLLAISKESFDSRLDLLHSVLRIPTSAGAPVRLLHLSFRDFLLHSTDPTMPFRIDAKQTHASLAAHCLRILGSLKKDPCNLRSPGMIRSAISDAEINSALPPELQYACLYLAYHSEKANIQLSDDGDAYRFLTQHFLHWIEALALLGRASDSLAFLKLLQLQATGKSSVKCMLFLKDATRFLQSFMSTIILAPLQLYSSLIIFSPKRSEVRKIFETSDEGPSWVCLKPRTKEYWGSCIQTLEDHTYNVSSVAFSHDSTLLASISRNKLCIWRVGTTECRQIRVDDGFDYMPVVFSHDSALITSTSGPEIRIWQTNTLKCVQRFKDSSDHSGFLSVVFTRDSTHLVSGSRDATIRLWSIETGNCVKILMLKGFDTAIWSYKTNWSIVFSHDATLIAANSSNDKLRLWRTDTGECIQTLTGRNAVFSLDSSLVASGGGYHDIKVWRVGTGMCLLTLAGHRPFVRSLAFSHDATLIASDSDNNTIRIWNISSGVCQQILTGHHSVVSSLVFSHDATLIASGSRDGTIRIWHNEANNCAEMSVVDRDRIFQVILSRTATFAATASMNRLVQIWCTEKGAPVQTLAVNHDWWDIVISHNSAMVAAASSEMTVRIWKAKTGRCLRILRGHTDEVTCIAFSRNSALLVSGSNDTTLRIWAVKAGECLRELVGHGDWIDSVAFSRDSALVVSSANREVLIWRVDTGECIRSLRMDSYYSMALSTDATLVASCSNTGEVDIVRADTGELVQSLDIGYATNSLAFSRDDSCIKTDCGTVSLESGTMEGFRIGIRDNWITWNGKRLLWLPVEFRPHSSSVSKSTVVINTTAGSVIFVGISPELLPDI